MKIIDLAEIRRRLVYPEVIERMREALMAQSRGECETPMPMHLYPGGGEVHVKSSYRRGGKYFALKVASTFPGSIGNGMMLLSSAETGAPVAFLADQGHLTDVRTAAVAAMVARELGRRDRVIGILGTGIQARLQARMHAEVLDLERIWIWGRNERRAEACCEDVRELVPGVEVTVSRGAAYVASKVRLLITVTGAREAFLQATDLQEGTHVTAVGSDSPGKQELDPEILRRAGLLLVDSVQQCEKLGELQHAPDAASRAVEIGAFCERGEKWGGGISVCDLTGLGVEDLFIAEYCYENRNV